MRAVLLALIVTLAGCEDVPGQKREKTTNARVEVDLLFEHDGCKVYRFLDNGVHYFARCPDSTSVSSRVSCGKNCTKDEVVPTAPAK